MEMEWFEIGGMMIGLVVGLMALGIPVAFAFLLSNIVGAFLFMGGLAGVEQLINNCTRSVSSFLLVPVPLFILMGEALAITGIGRDLFRAAQLWLHRIPGSLAIGTIFASIGTCGASFGADLKAVVNSLKTVFSAIGLGGTLVGAGGESVREAIVGKRFGNYFTYKDLKSIYTLYHENLEKSLNASSSF